MAGSELDVGWAIGESEMEIERLPEVAILAHAVVCVTHSIEQELVGQRCSGGSSIGVSEP